MSRPCLDDFLLEERKMKKVLKVLMAVMMILAMTACGPKEEASDDAFHVGVVQLVQHDALDAATQGFVDALVSEFGED